MTLLEDKNSLALNQNATVNWSFQRTLLAVNHCNLLLDSFQSRD